MWSDLSQLELLTRIDELIHRLSGWASHSNGWESLERTKRLLGRILERVDPLRLRMDTPLVVATFGGTGVGKSSLVNALIGDDVAVVGRQRPTTLAPALIYHRETDLQAYQFPIDEMKLVPSDSRLLRDWMIVDCPDPDTSESDDTGTNLARLHQILPCCDVLLYVSTQQKYRSAKVSSELAQAAAGCKLIFIQTHAEQDADIRDDWRRQLEPAYRVHDMFFVDSRRAMQEQRMGLRPTEDFGRLLDVLEQELSAAQRVKIRQGNLFGLLNSALSECLTQLQQASEGVRILQQELQAQRQHLTMQLADRLATELLSGRGLWERRLLGEIAQRWGLSPFALVLRAWHGQANLLASWTLMRARSSAQVALWGAIHSARWWSARQQEQSELRQSEEPRSLDVIQPEWEQACIVIKGHARSAGLRTAELAEATRQLSQSAASAQECFWTSARAALDSELAAAVTRHSRPGVRWLYEVGFAIFPLWLIYRIGRNFFYDSWINQQPLLETNFYIPALLFLALWTGLVLMVFTARLRRGMSSSVRELTASVANRQLPFGLFPGIEQKCREFHDQVEELVDLSLLAGSLTEQISDSPSLSRAISGHLPVDR